MIMAAVESLGIDPVDVSKASGKIAVGSLNQEVIVVGHEAIGCDPKVKGLAGFLNSLEEDLVVPVVPEDQLASSPPVEDMIPGIGIFHSQRARHNSLYPEDLKESRADLTPLPPLHGILTLNYVQKSP